MPAALAEAIGRGDSEEIAQGLHKGTKWTVSVVAGRGILFSSDEGYRFGKASFSVTPASPIDHYFVAGPDQVVVFGVVDTAGSRVAVRLSDGKTTDTVAKPLGNSDDGVFVLSIETGATPVAIELQDGNGTVVYAGEAHGRRIG